MYVYAFAHSLVFNALCRGQRSGAIRFAMFGQHRASVGLHKEIQCVPHTTGSMSANWSLGIRMHSVDVNSRVKHLFSESLVTALTEELVSQSSFSYTYFLSSVISELCKIK